MQRIIGIAEPFRQRLQLQIQGQQHRDDRHKSKGLQGRQLQKVDQQEQPGADFLVLLAHHIDAPSHQEAVDAIFREISQCSCGKDQTVIFHRQGEEQQREQDVEVIPRHRGDGHADETGDKHAQQIFPEIPRHFHALHRCVQKAGEGDAPD